jgi:hypothetical protein
MTANESLQMAQIRAALAELDQLARAEYDEPLEALLLSRDHIAELRVQRLVGVALKRKFAKPAAPAPYSATKAKRSWPWPDGADSMVPVEADASRELALLEQLRMPGSWNECKSLTGTAADREPVSWSEFKGDAEHERGLFKIIALYAADKFNGRERRTLKAYLEAPESRRFEAGLNLAELLFDVGVTGPLAGVLGVPTLAVGVALVGMQYGYRKLSDNNTDRMGDSNS